MNDQLTSDLESLRIHRDEPARPAARGPARSRRGAVTALAAVGAVGALGYGAVRYYPYVAARVFKTTVHTTEVSVLSPAQATTTLTATGYVIPRVLSRVAARSAGRVARVLVREGDAVRAGQVLLELDAVDQQSAIAASRARVLAAQARAAAARANLAEVRLQADRQRLLARRGAAPRAAAEDLDARAAALAAAVEAAHAEVGAARADAEVQRVALGQRTVLAPIDGTVLNRPPGVGEMLDPLTSVLDLADMASLVVEVDVPETRLELVRPGGPCEVALDAFPARRLRGATLETGRRIDRAKATVPVRVRFTDAAAGVLPNMAARVSFLTEALAPAALREAARAVVPAAAVTSRAGARVVFAVDDGVARVRRVRLGARIGDAFELLAGPRPRTRLVAEPPDTLEDGQHVRETSQ